MQFGMENRKVDSKLENTGWSRRRMRCSVPALRKQWVAYSGNGSWRKAVSAPKGWWEFRLENNSFESKLENMGTGCICEWAKSGRRTLSSIVTFRWWPVDHAEEEPSRKYKSVHSQQRDSAFLSPCLKIYFARFWLKWLLLVGLIFSILLTLPLSDQFSLSSVFDLCSSLNYIIHFLLTFVQVQQRISQLSYEAEQDDFRYSLILYFFHWKHLFSPSLQVFIKTCLNGCHWSFWSNRRWSRKQGKEFTQFGEYKRRKN